MTTTTAPELDQARAEAFAERTLGILTDGCVALMGSLGHQLGLFDTLAELAPSTSAEVAEASGLHERYVREWLGAMVTAGIVDHDPTTRRYHLPPEHAASLTRAAGDDNLARLLQFVPLLAGVHDPVADCFRHGGGVGYEHFAAFQAVMADTNDGLVDALLVDQIVPLAPGLETALAAGTTVADIGCGRGHAAIVLARAFPDSTVVGYDIDEDAIAHARGRARDLGVTNVRFEVRDVADLHGAGPFGLVLALDAVHDQAQPATVLEGVARALAPDGTFLMVDIAASSDVSDNVDLPWAPFLYTVSTLHCMTVSLAQDGAGLGTAWGRQLATQMLGEAGFGSVDVHALEEDPFDLVYVARRT